MESKGEKRNRMNCAVLLPLSCPFDDFPVVAALRICSEHTHAQASRGSKNKTSEEQGREGERKTSERKGRKGGEQKKSNEGKVGGSRNSLNGKRNPTYERINHHREEDQRKSTGGWGANMVQRVSQLRFPIQYAPFPIPYFSSFFSRLPIKQSSLNGREPFSRGRTHTSAGDHSPSGRREG